MKPHKLLVVLAVGISFISPFLPYYASWAQNLDEAAKEVDKAVSEEKLEKKLIPLPKKPPEIKEEEEKITEEGPLFFIKKVKLEGVESFPEEIFKPITEEYENRNVSFSELKILTKKIEREYLKRGIIAACYIPPQEIEEGIVILNVVEARMGQLNIKDHRYFFNDRLAYYWHIKPGEILRYDKLSRSLQLMNKNPDRFTKAVLHAGKILHTTDITLDTETNFPLHTTLSLDREGATSTGKLRKGIGFVDNNFMGLDDTFLGGYTGGKNFGGVYAYHRIPITNYGTSVLYGYSQMRAFPKKDYEIYEMSSRTETASIFLHQDLFHKDEYVGEIKVGLEGKDKTLVWREGTLNRDRLRTINVGGLLLDRERDSVTYLKPEFSQGLNFLGAKRRDEYSTREATNTFSKSTLGANFKKALALGVQANMKFQAQYAGERLMPQEEFYLGGLDSVRGYPDGDFLADTGFYTNLELLVPCFILPEKLKFPYGSKPFRDEITGVLFFDWGYGEKRNALATELTKRKFASLGLGVRIKLLDQANLRLEWGWPLDKIADMPRTEYSQARFHFSFDFQDTLPGEIERVHLLMQEDNIKEYAWFILNQEMKNPESPLRKKLELYLYLAGKSYKEGDFRQAEVYYAKIAQIGRSAHRQAENYVREIAARVKELKGYDELASKYYDEGRIEEAKIMWQRVKEEAKIKPLVIEIL